MVPSRTGPKGAEVASFGLAILVFFLTPSPIGYQDLAALLAQQPAVAARSRDHLIASPFGTIHAATFSLPRPVGTIIPEPPMVRLASLSGDASDITGSIGIDPYAMRRAEPPIVFPVINRTGKGDRLIPSMPQVEPASEDGARSAPSLPAKPSIFPARDKTTEIDHSDDELPDAQTVVLAELAREAHRRNAPVTEPDEIAAAMHFVPFPEYDIALSLELDPKIPSEEAADLADLDPTEFTPNAPPSLEGLNAEVKTGRLYFGHDLFGTTLSGIRPWESGEIPVLETPVITADPDFKQSPAVPATAAPGVTIAGKGEVTGEDKRPKSPAERLALAGPKRAKAEKCLANAVYFEARSEPVRGQIAVAQVVMNRVFSGYYPSDVCGVVYQNAHRHLACQFTFACDGIPDVVNDEDAWERAKRIARETLDGKLWLTDVAKATHYHATYVRPYWVRAMHKNAKIGLHSFYRPRRWGDGADEPSWGSATYTADAAAKM
jgi:spore germination cell wall hydrolase CwlJ-like protein